MTQSLLMGLMLVVSGASGAEPAPLKEAPRGTVGYATVDQALKAVRGQRGVVETKSNGWIVLEDEANSVLWTFAPSTHPAYPAVVKRAIVERDDAVSLDMKVLCQASKKACDDLVREFQGLNEQMHNKMEPHL